MLNKIDRLITELELSPLDAYLHLKNIIQVRLATQKRAHVKLPCDVPYHMGSPQTPAELPDGTHAETLPCGCEHFALP